MRKCPDNLRPSFQLLVDPFHAIGSSDPFLVRFRERDITQQPRKKPFDRVRGFAISSSREVIGEGLQSLFVAVGFPELVGDFSLLVLGNVSQDGSCCMNLTHLPRGPEECGHCRSLNSLMTVRDDELNTAQTSFFQLVEKTGPERLIFTRGNPSTEHLAIPILPDTGNDEKSFRDIPGPSRTL